MENRLQYILLSAILTLIIAPQLSAEAIDDEFFDIGISAGVINIEDFGSETIVGANISFKASEDFFLQFNYLEAEAALSSYEKIEGSLFSGDDRDFRHYNMLLGYTLLPGEFFTDKAAHLSNLYLVAGVGDTQFGGESSFSYTIGIGYQVAFVRNWIVRFDWRNYLYKSSILEEDNITNNVQWSVGLSYLL